MRKLVAALALLVCLFASQAADAAIPNVFGTLTCTTQASGQRFCGTSLGSTQPSFDGTPIDVSVAFPPVPASGPDGNFPVIGLYHGYGNQKILPSSATAQRWLTQGYAVFAIQDRGFFASCGVLVPVKPPSCAKGYIHLLHNAYEVRDAQYLLGKLADQGVIDPQRIGATGGSYGGGMSAQLGALKDRVQMFDGSTIAWVSPVLHLPMRIAATAPEFPWTDLAQSLMPNGSNLDYVADSPYLGPLGDHRFGIQKQKWNTDLYNGGAAAGFYSSIAQNDPTSNVTIWKGLNDTGGPYDGDPRATEQINELPNHGAYGTNMDEPPAPALLSNGWNDDLFPVDETVRYYNKVRSVYPNAAIKLFDLDFGHNPRAATPAASDLAKLVAAENAWFSYYVKGTGSEPAGAHGGVDAITSACPGATAGTQYTASNWATLAPGEIRLDSPDPQTIHGPGTAPANAFTSGTVCTTQAAGDNASAATYKLAAAPAGGFTILGSSTVIAEISTVGANDAVYARLYDVAPGGTQQLIGRALYRPMDVGAGFTKQIFQLHPQAWKVDAGHVVKLELLAQDPTYARTSTGQHDVQVRNLQLRIPTADAPGAAGGLVTDPEPKYVPPGYRLARDVRTSTPGAPHITSGTNPNATGEFTLGWDPSDPATDLLYALQHRDANDGAWSNVNTSLPTNAYAFTGGSPEGEGTWKYRVNAHDPATAYSDESAGIKVDKTKPNAPSVTADRSPDYTGDDGWYKDTVDVSVTDNGDPSLSDTSDGSGVDVGSLPPVATYNTSGSHFTSATVKDAVGNESDSASLTVQVDATDPNLSVTCPSAVLLHAAGVSATVSASDGESGLASDPSDTVAIDTSTVGPKTVTRTAVDNVGHSVEESCTTQVQYMYGGIQQPVNPDGSSIFKLGSTVPVKFSLTDADAASVSGAVATLSVAKISNSVEGNFVEAVSTSNATTGSLFRESGTGQYIFNLSTKGLSAGTWSLKVTLDDGTSYTTQISLR
jgi:X-Pro dipeptidyl-peptidase (S15 family)